MSTQRCLPIPEQLCAMATQRCARSYANLTYIGAHDSFAFSKDVLAGRYFHLIVLLMAQFMQYPM